MKKEYTVFSMKLAAKLMLRGFALKRTEITKQDKSNRNVFIFNESKDLLNAIHELSK